MRFNNIFEEEYYFPCEGLTLDEGREFRYLMNNTFDFLDGDIIQMQLIKNGEVISTDNMTSFDVDWAYDRRTDVTVRGE